MSVTSFDYLIVGAGFAGAVIAHEIATQLDRRVLVVDKRRHIAGNMYDFYNDEGILVHKYGPHIFHTNSKRVFDYLSQFTEWRHYQHRVLAFVDGQLVPLPINLDTINRLRGANYSSDELQGYFDSIRIKDAPVVNSRDAIVSQVGEELYEKFFKNYTKKQWDRYPEELDASVSARIPVRTNRDDRYFTDTYQGLPKHGYTKMFEKILDHPNIHVMLGVDYRDIRRYVTFDQLVYTGPVDEYFDYCYGKLPYRSLKFVQETRNEERFQSVGTVNYPNSYDFTRITEMKHLTGQQHEKTAIVYEYPQAEGDPYYPVPIPESRELYKRYEALADAEAKVTFLGRLGTYRYYNMDQIVAQALTVFEKTFSG